MNHFINTKRHNAVHSDAELSKAHFVEVLTK